MDKETQLQRLKEIEQEMKAGKRSKEWLRQELKKINVFLVEKEECENLVEVVDVPGLREPFYFPVRRPEVYPGPKKNPICAQRPRKHHK